MDKAVLGEDIILKSKGQQRYSYCYIADAVSGLLKLLLDGQDGEACKQHYLSWQPVLDHDSAVELNS